MGIPNVLKPTHSVIAIDPANVETAYLWLRGDGKILSFGKLPNVEFEEWYAANLPKADAVACEMICSYGMPAGASLFETCLEIGRLQQMAKSHTPFYLIPRLEVKLSICRSPQANDSTIRAALIDQFGPPGKKSAPGPTFGISADVWAALALAETFRRGEYREYVWSDVKRAASKAAQEAA